MKIFPIAPKRIRDESHERPIQCRQMPFSRSAAPRLRNTRKESDAPAGVDCFSVPIFFVRVTGSGGVKLGPISPKISPSGRPQNILQATEKIDAPDLADRHELSQRAQK
jgi:hypothetical protein